MEEKNTTVKKESVPIWEKYALTIYEAAEYFNIGEHRLRQLVRENRQADFVLWIGTKVEIKREKIAEKAKEVIEKNLATVQQIACTLGEHMAETEVLLRSIAKDYAADDYDRPKVTIRNKRDE